MLLGNLEKEKQDSNAFFHIQYKKFTIKKLPTTLPTKYYTTLQIQCQGGEIYQDSPLALNMELKDSTNYKMQSSKYREGKTFLRLNT